MKILITGANGFVGKTMVRRLSSEHEVYAVVRDQSKLPVLNNVQYVEHDFTNRLNSGHLPESIDSVIHLAQSSQYRNFPVGMRDMCDVNISGLVDVLEYARNTDCEYFINYSSGSVYQTDPRLQSEETEINPSNAYPLTKRISEQITNLYSEFFQTLNIRLFFPYGPGQAGMLVPNIINSVRNGKPIDLQGNDGGLKICPILVDDVVSISNICLKEKTTGVINVAGPEVISLQALAQEIGQQLDKEPVFTINVDASPAEFNPTTNRLNSILQGKMLTRFSEGIKSTVAAHG